MNITTRSNSPHLYSIVSEQDVPKFEEDMKDLYELIVELYEEPPVLCTTLIFRSYDEDRTEEEEVVTELLTNWIHLCFYALTDQDNIYGVSLSEMTDDMRDNIQEQLMSEYAFFEDEILDDFKLYLRNNNFFFADKCEVFHVIEDVNSPLQEVW